jgi:hypothetical protein
MLRVLQADLGNPEHFVITLELVPDENRGGELLMR